MWEMQVLSSQRNNNKNDEGASGGSGSGTEYSTSDDRLGNENTEPLAESPDEEHPAMRGLQTGEFNKSFIKIKSHIKRQVFYKTKALNMVSSTFYCSAMLEKCYIGKLISRAP